MNSYHHETVGKQIYSITNDDIIPNMGGLSTFIMAGGRGFKVYGIVLPLQEIWTHTDRQTEDNFCRDLILETERKIKAWNQ